MSDDRVKHILVPVDTETIEVSDKALKRACALARSEGARLTLMTVSPACSCDTPASAPHSSPTR